MAGGGRAGVRRETESFRSKPMNYIKHLAETLDIVSLHDDIALDLSKGKSGQGQGNFHLKKHFSANCH